MTATSQSSAPWLASRPREDSDIELLITPSPGSSSFDLVEFKELLEQVLGRGIDLISWGGLKPGLDDDIRREAVLL